MKLLTKQILSKMKKEIQLKAVKKIGEVKMNEQKYNDLCDCIETDYEYISLKYSKEISNSAIFFGILLDIIIKHMMICAPSKEHVMDLLKIVIENIKEKEDE
jgi:hypothetical protein